MLQALIRVGNSLAVTVPRHFIKARKLHAGQKIFVEADSTIDLMQVRSQTHTPTLTGEFKEWLDEVSTKYERVIKELARR